ncbi:hypothetical protein E2C01_075925 [Portunus trituberculatus]|uniref:Uncharacterized protein n=1 Tax=Portunus trituberculatus TaxID=210409 RepID=A0A5B7IKN7_PORTR|nr:hypothetical protein [Portunus trituberculatus]
MSGQLSRPTSLGKPSVPVSLFSCSCSNHRLCLLSPYSTPQLLLASLASYPAHCQLHC